MSFRYVDVFRAVALRTNQFVGGAKAARETAYTDIDPTGQTDGIELPPAALKQDILTREREIVQAVGMSDNSTLRSALMAASDPLASSSEIPTVDVDDKPFYGKPDGIYDSSDSRSLTEVSKEKVDNYLDAPSFFQVRPYHFARVGTIIYHTRPNVFFRGVSWDWDTQSAAYDGKGDSPLHASLEGLLVDLVCANCPQEGWFISESDIYLAAAKAKWSLFFPGQKMQDTNVRMYPGKD